MSTPTILIVDDEVDLRDAIAFDFRRKKFKVLTAASGNEAMEIVRTTTVDIVLSDVCMPDGGGVELLDRIKARDALMPVVMLITGFADITLEQAYDKGADAVFSKPFDRQALMAAVLNAVQPVEQRFRRRNSRVEVNFPLGFTLSKDNSTLLARVSNLGRGGMFLTDLDRFPGVGDEIDFQLKFQESVGTLSGSGVIRWVRKEASGELPAGCGVEFQTLTGNSATSLVGAINFVKTKSYIPIK